MEQVDANSDVELLRRLRQGDAQAAEIVVRRLSPLVARLVFRLTGWHADIDDLVQEVFLHVQQNADTFRGKSRLETWVTSIAINRCRNWRRAAARTPRSVGVDDVRNATSVLPEVPWINQDFVRTALQQLDHADRELLVLKYLEEKTLNEICDLFQERKNTIEVRLHRARQRMKNVLQQLNRGCD